MPDDTGAEAAAILREVWHLFPKALPNLITAEPEEEPDER